MKKLTVKGARRIAGAVIAVLIVAVGASAAIPNKSVTIVASAGYTPIYNGDRGSDKVALMFNVYEGAEIVDGILEVLAENDAKATFFVGGCWADDNEETLIKILEAGHELGNHGYFHLDQKKLGLEENIREIKTNHKLIQGLTGVEMTLFAPPSGAFGKDTLEAAEKLGYKTIMWTKDTIDWRDKSPEKVFSRATKDVAGGDLILMHPKKHTLTALADILAFYKQKGLRAVTVSDCIGEDDL